MHFYNIEQKIGGEWVFVSQHGLWGEGRKVLDRLQNKHGASYVRMIQTTSLVVNEWPTMTKTTPDTEFLAPLLEDAATPKPPSSPATAPLAPE